MEEKDVLRFLRCESSDLVEFAVKMANLTWKEELAITLCGRKDKTRRLSLRTRRSSSRPARPLRTLLSLRTRKLRLRS